MNKIHLLSIIQGEKMSSEYDITQQILHEIRAWIKIIVFEIGFTIPFIVMYIIFNLEIIK